MVPKVHYAETSSGLVAYQVFGAGPVELVLCEGLGSQIEITWEHPAIAGYLNALGSFARVVFFDPRGVGLSDDVRNKEHPTWEDGIEDFKAVIAAAGLQRPALFLSRDAARQGLLFAATNPDRVSALILANATACHHKTDGYPEGHSPERSAALEKLLRDGWGDEAWGAQLNPSLAGDAAALRWYARMRRASASPGRALERMRYSRQFDARPFLSAIRVPTLILHSEQYPFATVPMARYLARQIEGARLIVLPGMAASLLLTHTDELLAAARQFLTGMSECPQADRILATVVFADVVGSSDVAAQIGDRRWKEIQQQFFDVAREELTRFGGREVDTAGDGYFAAFDGPGRAVRFAERVRSRMEDMARPLRFGIHVGECERVGDKLTGLAVNIGARVCAKAQPGEILVSGTVRDLLMGSGVRLEDRGMHELKGIPGAWPLLALAA